MKMTMTDGTVFEGSMAEYAELLAWAERKTAEELKVGAPETVEPTTYKDGDNVRIIGESISGMTEYIGKLGKVTQPIDFEGDIRVAIEDDLRYFKPESLEYGGVSSAKNAIKLRTDEVERVESETITFEGDKYRKVEREPRENDVVIARYSNGHVFKINTPYKVTSIGTRGAETEHFVVYRDDKGRTTETIDVYEKVAEAKSVEVPYVPQEGDIVVITENTNNSRNKVGDIGKVRHTSPLYAIVDVPQRPSSFGVNGNLTLPTELRLATTDEIAQYEHAVKDREKVAEEIAKWAKIGRKPGEFKRGDIVRVLAHKHGRKIGEIGVIENPGIIRKTGVGVRFGDRQFVAITESNEEAELIAPVDARFDK